MKKRIITSGLWVGIFMSTVIVAYAITTLFFTSSERSNFSKKTVFRFDLSTDIAEMEVGPGDSFNVKPVVYNDGTKEMYVFIQIDMPTTVDGVLYSFDADDEWYVVSENEGTIVYAYGGTEMTTVQPGDSTSVLTEQMTMKSISNAEYAGIDDINITITAYAMGTEDMSSYPVDAWNECKWIGNIQ